MSTQSENQRIAIAMQQLRYIRSEAQSAFNPQSIRDRLIDTLNLVEYVVSGQVTTSNNSTAPAVAPSLIGPPQAHVETSLVAPRQDDVVETVAVAPRPTDAFVPASIRQIRYIRSESQTAFNAQSIRDRVIDTLNVLEYLLTGQVTSSNPNTVPGTPADLLDDPTKTRVEFTSGPGAAQQRAERDALRASMSAFNPVLPAFPTPGQPVAALPSRESGRPIVNGDVQFIPGPPPGTSTGVGGQTVEYTRSDGTPVDVNGNPIGSAPPAPAFVPFQPAADVAPAAPIIPGADYRGATRVEIIGGTHRAPPRIPGAPVNNEGAQIVGHQPSHSTEAGGQVLPTAGLFPGVPAAAEPPPGAPRTAAEARSALGSIIPLAE